MTTEDFLEVQIDDVEKRLTAMMQTSAEADLLKTLPYVGPILSMVMALEIGKVERFASAAHLASYAGLVPRVHSSGGHTRLGQICGDINRYLKWAFIEAGTRKSYYQEPVEDALILRFTFPQGG